MNKKIIISLCVIGAIAAIAIGGTMAYFSDTETSTGNTFTAGTIDLNLDNGNTNVVKFTVTNANPGQKGTGYWTVKNVGSLTGYLDIEPITLADDDINCNDAEIAASDATCDAIGGGDLSANMDVVLFVDVDHDGVVDGEDTPIYNGKLNAIVLTGYNSDIELTSMAEKFISLNWEVPSTTGNIIQSDKTTLGLTFELAQTTGQ